MNDKVFMRRAIKLARRAEGWTNPNPLVGAVIVKNGRIVGEGFHQKSGGPHAEVNAIKNAGGQAKNSTIYVSFEPCSHYGKTPPCTEAIIRGGVKKVVFACNDPAPRHSAKILRWAGLKVESGLLENEAKELNRPFLHSQQAKRPYIAVKFASSLDGKLATKTRDSKWITNEKSREFARKLRGKYQAVLVGANTVKSDNPHLGSRDSKLKDPLRIILDSDLSCPIGSQVFRDKNAVVFTTKKAPAQKVAEFEAKSIKVIKLNASKIDLKTVMDELYELNIISVFVEGGGETIGSFFDDKLVERVYAFYAPVLIGGEKAVSITGIGTSKINNSLKLAIVSRKNLGDDMLIVADTI